MEIESKRSSLVKEWFKNLLEGNINNEILLLKNVTENVSEMLTFLLKKYNCPRNKYKIANALEYISTFHKDKDLNIILILPMNKNSLFIDNMNLLNRSLLFIPNQNEFYAKIEDYVDLSMMQNSSQIEILEKERYLYYIEKIDPLHLIKNRTKTEIIAYLKFVIDEGLIPWFLTESYSVLIDKSNFKIGSLFNSIQSDLEMLNSTQVLTSRLAIIIYRVAMLSPESTTTEVGRYFHKKIGSKSKTYNYKLLHKRYNLDSGVVDKELGSNNFKAYDLTKNESEKAIRVEIAKNLLSLNLVVLNSKKIADATKLPIDEVEKLLKN
ncbi:hypothetical protein [Candidatus Sulfurimonas baltica]|uniref:Uncharacterized protein n=1 Tax=Candidatus Sulfurimonas baltica TaxID=2740404 RepID=A0A7S7LU63_9BACT|nr:hypothetical protein [Candidatus Sulfurimonas baltica]QOY51365.1 hypothetical protein HUE88_09560 [Candidatus Sulfurimonas baltica]